MGILDTLSSFRAPLTLLLVIFGPSFLPRIFNLIRRRNNPTTPITPSEPLSTILKAFLALNTIYYLVHLYYPPYDLFTSARLPILAPNALVRRAVLATSPASPGVTLADPSASNPVIELLLQRLQNADHRINYARFGHGPLTQCVWCTSSDDFLLYSLPDIISAYAYAAVFLGVISSQAVGGEGAGKRAEKWRNTVGLGIGGLCLADLAARYLWDLRPVQGDCLHLSSTIHTLRSIALLLIPLVYSYLPLPSSAEDISTLIPGLAKSLQMIRLTNITRLAVKRDHRFRRMDLNSSEEDARRAAAFAERVKTDEDLKSTVDAVVNIPQERTMASRWVQQNWISWIKQD